MTRLLVSVRSFDEACLAAEAGVDLIDLKEPRHGSLGCVGLDTARQICEQLGQDRPLSMALGELAKWSDAEWALAGQILQGIRYAKVGLAGCATLRGWRSHWQRAIRSFPAHCLPVAVIYADWREASAPEPETVLGLAIENGCRVLLIDTWEKTRGNIFAHCDVSAIDAIFRRAQQYGLLTVLAGSLTLDNLDQALALAPDFVAVRGAVCSGSRNHAIAPEKIRQWCELIGERPKRPPACPVESHAGS